MLVVLYFFDDGLLDGRVNLCSEQVLKLLHMLLALID